MADTPTLHAYVAARLTAIQAKHNFNPNGPITVILPPMMREYGQFQELLRIIDSFKLDAKIPYDPCGLAPAEHQIERAAKPVALYVSRQVDTTIHKIGSSINPFARNKALQTGCHVQLALVHVVWGNGRLHEKVLKHHLQRFKTRDRNNPQSGEWFDLEPAHIHDLIQQIKKGTFPIPEHIARRTP